MLGQGSQIAASAAPANVGLTAFQVAVVQAKVFEKTLEEVSDRAEKTAETLEQKAKAEQQRAREQLAKQRGGVDVVVDGSAPAPTQKAADSSDPPANGGEVDIQV
jgi:3-hydroxyacyl-CoA dehydrogenase